MEIGKKIKRGLMASCALALPFAGYAQNAVHFEQTGTQPSLIIVDAKVDGSPAKLLLDTGAQYLVASDGLLWGKNSLDFVRISGAGTTAARLVRAEITLGSDSFEEIAATMDMKRISANLQMHVDGLLGQDVLSRYSRIEIDYKAHTLTFVK